MIVNKEFILAAYCEACNTLQHSEAVAQVAALTGQAVETVEQVVREEETV